MKKILLVLLGLVIFITATACQAKKTGTNNPTPTISQNKNLDGSLDDILKKIYDTVKVEGNFKQFIGSGVETKQITADRTSYYLGKEGIEFDKGIASEGIMSPSAYSLCLVRVKKGADIEKIKKDIKDNVDPQKWICVGVDPKNILVDNIGDVVILIMSNEAGKELHEAFLALKK